MAQPTTGVYFSQSTPAAPPGDQIAQPQTDGASPEQSVTFVPQRATTALRGTVKPDGTSITIDADGTIHAVATSGGGTGGTTTSGGAYICVTPSGAKDGSNTQYTIPATVLAGSAFFYVTNGVMERQLGIGATFAVQGTQITRTFPLQSDDWHEFYFVPGSASSETGGGGSVTPVTAALVRATSAGAGSTGGSSVVVSFPSGTQVGDLLVICCNNDWNLTVPSGWTNNNLSNGVTWNGMVISRVMTSGDIATGSVTIIAAGSNDWAYIATAFIGAVGGIRETDVVSTSGDHTDSITTSSAVASTDVALYFGSQRGGTSAISISRGGAQNAVTGPNTQSNLNTEALTAAGAYSVNFTYTSGGGGGTYSAVIIVKAF